MVRKIQATEYLKRVDNMTAVEREAYTEMVGRWLASGATMIADRVMGDFNARVQNVLTISAGWNDAECSAFEEGAQLLTALMGRCETWLPEMLYAKSAWRCVRRMAECLRKSSEASPTPDPSPEGEGSEADAEEERAASPTPDPSPVGEVGGTPARPKHIDQYVHLLPKRTQERAGEVRELYRKLDELRERERLLMDASDVNDDTRAGVGKAIVQVDNRLGNILRELDAEWEKLVQSGRVVVDIFGNASVVGGDDGEHELSSEDKVRRRSIRKWLGDTRYGNHDEETRKEHVRKWKEKFAEYLTIEGDAAYADNKIVAAAKHYGIELKH